MRLLLKLAFINERPEGKGYWSDTGDRYIVRLFRDFVFHQKDEANRPVLDCGHVLDALAKLDVGDPETIPLCSPDGKTVLVRGERVRRAGGADAAGSVREPGAALRRVHADVRKREWDAIKTTNR